MISNLFALDRSFERAAERILTYNADADRVSVVREGARGPLYEFGEVIKERRLDLILVEPAAFGR